MLVLDQIRFAYPGQADTYDFSLSVSPGEIVAVTGVSGSGKSTLLDLIAGFQRPQSGTILLDSLRLENIPADRRPVSILFQDDNVFDHLSASANLALALPHDDPAQRQRAITKALEEVGLQGFAGQKANRLSGGQKQRVALARTLLLGRPVLLLDEPFSALDAETAADMRELVRNLVIANNWHAILVSHQSEDAAMADRRLKLTEGRIALAR